MKKRMAALAIALVMMISLFPAQISAHAATDSTQYADTLKALGLFRGTEAGYELERGATRAEAAAMTVRLLGKEETAKEINSKHPFSDVPKWASCYIGYLYENDIAKGVSATVYNAAGPITPAQYATFMLRALGYDDEAGDFTWQKALDKMVAENIITKMQATAVSKNANLTRGDLVTLSYATVLARINHSARTLLYRLYVDDQAVTATKMKAAGRRDARVMQQAAVMGIVCAATTNLKALDMEGIYSKSHDAVFYIELLDADKEPFATGSGFFVTADGIAVTNFHVLEDAYSAQVRLPNGKTYPVSNVLGASRELDLAIIQVKGNGFPYLTLGDPDKLRVAQRVCCIGSPLGYENTVTDGLVSSTIKENPLVDNRKLIQISAPISRGSSGGALLNEYGQVVGVTSMTVSIGQNLNFAIPVTELSKVSLWDEPKSLAEITEESYWSWPSNVDKETETEPNDETYTQVVTDWVEFSGSLSDTKDVDLYGLEVETPTELFMCIRVAEPYDESISVDIVDVKTGEVVLASRHVPEDVPFRYVSGHLRKGTFAIRVKAGSSELNWSKVNYKFICSLTDSITEPTMPGEYSSLELEPNDDFDTACYVSFGGYLFGELEDNEDRDCYQFSLDQTTDLSIIVSPDTSNVGDFVAELYGPDKKTLISKLDVTSADLLEVKENNKKLAAGDYYVVISSKKGAELDFASYIFYVGKLPPDYRDYF